jgi:hypothetical protein
MTARSTPVADTKNDPSLIARQRAAAVKDAVGRLLLLLGPERILQLAQMLDDVATDTRFGDVKIIITDGRVRLLKVEKSYE